MNHKAIPEQVLMEHEMLMQAHSLVDAAGSGIACVDLSRVPRVCALCCNRFTGTWNT